MFRRNTPMAPSLSIRPAAVGDSGFLARIVQDAARGHRHRSFWQQCLQLDESGTLGVLEELVRSCSQSYPSYEKFLVCEDRGLPIAAGCGYAPSKSEPVEFWSRLSDTLVACGHEHTLIQSLLRVRPYLRRAPRFDSNVWVLESIAVLPGHRRKGAAALLVRALLASGLERGFSTSQLVCLSGNSAAITLYRALGFETERRPSTAETDTAPELILLTHEEKPERKGPRP